VRVSQSSDTLWQKCLPSSNGKREVNSAGNFFCLTYGFTVSDGPQITASLAQIYAWVGEKDQTLRLVDRLLQTPNGVTVPMLKLDPMWDPLGTDPRFQRLVALQAPSNTMP